MRQQVPDGGDNQGRIAQRLFRTSAQDSLPMSIRHERIYILPSSRGMAFICVLAIMLMASINYGLNLGYALCFILIGLFASCLLSTYKNLVQINFALVSVEDTFSHKPLCYKIKLNEQSDRDRNSITIQSEHASDTIDLAANGTALATLQINNSPRGLHSLGRLTVSSDYPLGLWRAWGYVHTPVQAYVYPRPEQPVVNYAGHDAQDGTPDRQLGEREYSGLKSYENTDSPSQVAWKKVASGAGWYSKEFETLNEQREIAIRWTDTPATLDDEHRLSRMCSWVVRAVEEDTAFTFELPGTVTTGFNSGRDHGNACLRALASYRQQPTKSQ